MAELFIPGQQRQDNTQQLLQLLQLTKLKQDKELQQQKIQIQQKAAKLKNLFDIFPKMSVSGKADIRNRIISEAGLQAIPDVDTEGFEDLVKDVNTFIAAGDDEAAKERFFSGIPSFAQDPAIFGEEIETLQKTLEEQETTPAWKKISDPDSATGFAWQDLNNPSDIRTNAPAPKAGAEVSIDLTPRTKSTIENQLLELDKNIAGFNEMERLFEPEFLTRPGELKAFTQKQLDKLGIKTKTDFLVKRARFINQSKERFLAYRKWVTGVAGGEKEFAEIAKAFPDVERNSPAEFTSNLEQSRRWARIVRKWLAETRQRGFSLTDTSNLAGFREEDVELSNDELFQQIRIDNPEWDDNRVLDEMLDMGRGE
jgi:hypothetical protein